MKSQSVQNTQPTGCPAGDKEASRSSASLSDWEISDIVERYADGIAVTDAEGVFRYLNLAHCRMFGYDDQTSLVGRSWKVLYSRRWQERIQREAFPVLQEQGSWTGHARGLRADGLEFDEIVSLKVLDGGGLLCTCSDINLVSRVSSDLKDSIMRDRELAEQKSRFFAMANHELRNPIGAISLGIEVLLGSHDQLDEEQRRRLASGLQRQVETMNSTMEKFMVLGSQFSGLLAFCARPTAILPLVRRCIEQEGCLPRILLHNELAETDMRDADERLLVHMVGNLISNAAKYSEPATPICVDLREEGDRLHITVSDKGRGIPDSDQQELFSGFFRASNSRDKPGSGLGLFLVKLCAQAHGGDIQFESREGRGSSFTLILHAPPSDSPMGAS